jgi:hypothetical protein
MGGIGEQISLIPFYRPNLPALNRNIVHFSGIKYLIGSWLGESGFSFFLMSKIRNICRQLVHKIIGVLPKGFRLGG